MRLLIEGQSGAEARRIADGQMSRLPAGLRRDAARLFRGEQEAVAKKRVVGPDEAIPVGGPDFGQRGVALDVH